MSLQNFMHEISKYYRKTYVFLQFIYFVKHICMKFQNRYFYLCILNR